MERYTYRPLLPAKHSIRLIQILPGLPQTDIHCRIIDYTIRDDRVSGLFEALSYVWGNTKDPKRIYIADLAGSKDTDALGGFLEITSNLYEALQELRDPHFPRTMWIDAVCINQDDIGERASQVNFMARIYSHASLVVIWLGPGEANETRELFAAIEDAAEIARHSIDDYDDYDDQRPHRHVQSEHEDEMDFLSTALDALLSRPWFSRVWVLQEAAAARNLIVRCGTFELPGTVFAEGVRCLQTSLRFGNGRAHGSSVSVLETMTWNISALDRPFSTRLHDSTRLHEILSGRSIVRGSSLGYLIERFYLHGVTDKRDTIYALLNLCNRDSLGFMKPNYVKTWAEVWADTIKQILGSETIVTTCTPRDQACMTLFGHVLGKVSLNDRTFSVSSRSFRGFHWEATWTLEPWCKSIHDDDVVFLAADAANPSVIRACDGHFDIISIALPTPLTAIVRGLRTTQRSWQDMLLYLKHGPRRVTLVWDWSPDYPSSCTSHNMLFESACAITQPHPDKFARKKDLLHVIASMFNFPESNGS